MFKSLFRQLTERGQVNPLLRELTTEVTRCEKVVNQIAKTNGQKKAAKLAAKDAVAPSDQYEVIRFSTVRTSIAAEKYRRLNLRTLSSFLREGKSILCAP